MIRVFFLVLACVLALPGYTQSRYEKLTSKYRLSHCKEEVETIRDRMRPAVRAIFSTSRKVPVKITKKLKIRAYTDGRAIFISPTFCELVPNDDEFSIVVGHEIAHILLRHIPKAMATQMAGRPAESLFESVTGFSLYGMGGRIGAIAFSKDHEREADYYGLYLAAYANYDISDAPDFWRRFSPKAGSWSWTHPTHPERSARAMLVVVDVEHKKRDLRDLVPDKPPPRENPTFTKSTPKD